VISQKPSNPADVRTAHFRRYFLYERLADSPGHRRYLRRAYADALSRARQQHPDLVQDRTPSILLCGVGAAGTAEIFCRFALGEFPGAQITLFDLRPEVLEKSQARLNARRIGRAGQITAQAGNALRMPFASASFDWIETDNFLQFIAREDLATLAANWQAVLKPGGLLTTRQFFALGRSHNQLVCGAWKIFCQLISAPSHEHRVEDVRASLLAEKFSAVDIWKAPKTFGLITALAAFKE
jgi:SAM-dependent methyltransferase